VVRLSERVNEAVMVVFCILLQDDRDDATVGRWQLSKLLTKFLASMTSDDVCHVRYLLQTHLHYTYHVIIIIKRQFIRRRNMSVDITRAHITCVLEIVVVDVIIIYKKNCKQFILCCISDDIKPQKSKSISTNMYLLIHLICHQ